jgi:hypothetical protein
MLKKIYIGILAVLALFLVWFFYMSGAFPRISSYHLEIDIKSGRMRVTRYSMLRKSESITTTVLTNYISPEELNAIEPEWKSVNNFAPASENVSPHYYFHGIHVQLHQVRSILGWTANDELRGRIVSDVLKIWQQTQTRHPAYTYLNALDKKLIARRESYWSLKRSSRKMPENLDQYLLNDEAELPDADQIIQEYLNRPRGW